jgi:hypothetical protein
MVIVAQPRRRRCPTGRRASVVELSRRAAAEGLATREPFLVEADRDGWLIAGRALAELPGRDR